MKAYIKRSVCWSDKVSYKTLRRKQFLVGTESVKDTAKSGQPLTLKRQGKCLKELNVIADS